MPMPVMRMDTTTTRITIMATMIIMIITVMITTMIMPHMATVTITITTTSIAITPIITTATSMLMTTNEPVAARDLAEREAAALYRLMTWLSPASLADWLDAMLRDGSGFCDATFLVHAYRATEAGEDDTLSDIAELAAAFVPSRERQLETTSQGRAFIDIARAAWDADGLDGMVAACRWRRRCTPSCMRWSRTGFPRPAGSFRSARPTASACW